MKHLFAPWRMEYIGGQKDEGCFLCNFPRKNRDDENLILFRGTNSFIIMNRFPYNPGHIMIAPYKHIDSIDKLDKDEIYEIIDLCNCSVKAIKECMRPDGFNIGMNLGKTAGAGVADHIHLHIVPRWDGDINFMPVLADTKVIPEALEKTYKKLKEAINKAINTV